MRLVHTLVAAVLLSLTTITVLGIEVYRDEKRIAVLSEELYNVSDPLQIKRPADHQNYLEDLQQRVADLEAKR